MHALAKFQSEFASNLLSQVLAAIPDRDNAALTVYRNTVMRGLIDALAANYPTIVKLVGEEWFGAAASEFIRHTPPASSILAEYGKEFATFLSDFPPAAQFPYLSDVAKIDWLWIESHFAADAPALPASALRALAGESLLKTRLQLHSAARLCACKHSAATIWLHNHADHAAAEELHVADTDEEVLITRTPDGVDVLLLCFVEYQFVAAIQNGGTLGDAAMAALAHNPDFPLASTLAKLINAGCFTDSLN